MQYYKSPNGFPRKKKSAGTIKKILLFTIILAIGLSVFSYHYYTQSIYTSVAPQSSEQKEISIIIKSGSTLDVVANKLQEKGLIKNATTFKIFARLNELDKKIVAGRFMLSPTLNVPEIFDKITQQSSSEIIFTIQEGLRISQIDQKLVDIDLIQPGEFIASVKNFQNWEKYPFLEKQKLQALDLPLEGYLYPDTYFLDPNTFHPDILVSLCLKNFQAKINSIEISPEKNLNDMVIMASILEREVFGLEDRKKVAGILWKRLQNNWTLGADATLIYVTNNPTITAKDLQLDSPYNTRKNLGLPPGPISNPSIEAIEAAINPTNTPYWFYITTLDTGEVIYATTNEEHNQNVQKHLR